MKIARFLVPALVVVALLAVPAFAEDPAHGAAPAAHDKNPLNVDVVVAIGTLVVFFALVIILGKAAWKPILASLKAREDAIRAQIEGAERANQEAKALLAEHQKQMAAAADEARAIVEEGRKDAESLRAKIHAEAQADAAGERDRAVRDIGLAKDQAMKELYEHVAGLATDVAGRIIQQKLDPAAHKKLVDDAVTSYESSRKKPGTRA
jgi:F-type H+-transporting ATPase subunit b